MSKPSDGCPERKYNPQSGQYEYHDGTNTGMTSKKQNLSS